MCPMTEVLAKTVSHAPALSSLYSINHRHDRQVIGVSPIQDSWSLEASHARPVKQPADLSPARYGPAVSSKLDRVPTSRLPGASVVLRVGTAGQRAHVPAPATYKGMQFAPFGRRTSGFASRRCCRRYGALSS